MMSYWEASSFALIGSATSLCALPSLSKIQTGEQQRSIGRPPPDSLVSPGNQRLAAQR